MKGRFASLTSRLVITAVLLVAMVSVLVGAATTLSVRSYLLGQLDDKVSSAIHRLLPPPGEPYQGPGQGYSSGRDGPQSVGTMFALPEKKLGEVLTADRDHQTEQLDSAAFPVLAKVPADGKVHHVDVPGLGSYEVMAENAVYTASDGSSANVTLVTGLPTSDVDSTVRSLIRVELLLALGAVLAAAAVGLTVVRRQLRPLREVAETAHTVAALPLDSGEIGVTSRVPDHLTDVHTEVGQVGSALNTLLAHVETSLSARHRSEQRIRQFVADASHELRTPLTTIAGYTELARRRPDDLHATETALAKVEEESARMKSLVEDLLLLARLDSGRPLERRSVDLTRMLLEAVSDARVVAPDHVWRLDLPDEAIELDGDEQRLHQVITNLLTNARKYTPAGTTVTVVARPDGFAVHDDGPGFPDGLAQHAFERFARGDVARNREGGVGLGLALVEAIVTAHGGRVTLTSVVGDTTIDVRLPVAVTPPPPYVPPAFVS